MNKLEEDLRIEKVKKRIGPRALKWKIKKYQEKNNWIRETNKSQKKTIKREESKLELLREIIKKVQRIEYREKIKQKRNEKISNRRN